MELITSEGFHCACGVACLHFWAVFGLFEEQSAGWSNPKEASRCRSPLHLKLVSLKEQ